ncbi:nucleotidyl transferase AbiEii/AbiGii toxin family protein [Rhodococcus sp. UFZ-B548]|uniref:nucleotidyl transferase AbiEii/AbiGii toxin family protein n=1 Tax=Rhodococcus sp. UFZ-B548 TaxID=2742212 RepID=UPI0015F364CE|nr:nucleotidyl transferase AbiEii/AbiGii toxin family protein [Rhodococcus sp. UFZ-B548]
MNQPGGDNLLVQARSALLDALEALDQHRDALIVIGAQAVYLRSGAALVALAESTKDSDLALNPRNLKDDPHLEDAMSRAGFYLNVNGQPGAWVNADGIPVDLMVPHGLSNRQNTKGRTPRLPPHDKMAMRVAVGLEGCIVDNGLMTITALDENDARSCDVLVAGSAALMVAKVHKIHERLGSPGRLQNKDAHDFYRMLVAEEETEVLAAAFRSLLADPISTETTGQALEWIGELFASPTATGSVMAGRAEEGIGNPTQVATYTSVLAAELIAALGD